MVQLGYQTKKEEPSSDVVSASDVQPETVIPMEEPMKPNEFKEYRPNRFASFALVFLIIYTAYFKWRTFMLQVSYRSNLALFWYSYVSMFAFMCLPCVMPHRDEYLRWRNFGKLGAVVICLLETAAACAVMSWKASPAMAPAIGLNALLTVIVAYFASHHRLFTYNPFAKIDKYATSRTTSRTNVQSIFIVQSRPFEILLENRGTEVFNANGFIVRRVVMLKQKKSVVEFTLPEISIIPGQILKLVPDIDGADANAVIIPGYRCFGLCRADNVTTTLKANKKDDISEFEENFLHLDMWENRRGFSRITHVIETKNGEHTVEVL